MYFNHSLAGAIAIKPIIDRFENKFIDKERTVLWFVGVTASVLPDFDLSYAIFRNLENHRSYITHGIFLYFIMFMLIYFLSYLQKKDVFGRKFFKVLSLVFITGILTHFIIDFMVGGIVLLAPFSYQVLGFDMNIRKLDTNWLISYLKSSYMFLEFFIALLFLLIMRGRRYFVARVFSLSYLLIAVLSFVIISSFFL